MTKGRLPDHEFVRGEPADEADRNERSDDGGEPAVPANALAWHVYVHAPDTFFSFRRFMY